MATTGVIRAWYDLGSQYIYWNVTQIVNPLAEYPGGGGYPATNLLDDFILLDYNLGADGYSSGSEVYIPWGVGVEDGYAVYINDNGGSAEALLANATSYATSKVFGVASTTTDYVITTGNAQVYCESAAVPGDSLYLSDTNAGIVTAIAPNTQNLTICDVGIASETKLAGIGLISIILDPKTPALLEQNIDI